MFNIIQQARQQQILFLSSSSTSKSNQASQLSQTHNHQNLLFDLLTSMTDNDNSNGKDGGGMSAAKFKIMLLVAMVLQNSMLVLVGRFTRSGVAAEDLYDVNHLVLVIELGKLLLSCAVEFYATGGALAQSFQTYVLDEPKDTLKSLVPAVLYLVQNTLLFVALSNLSAPLFQVTYQGKLVTTAIVSVILLNRKYNFQQWVCLVILSIGVAVVVLAEKKDGGKKNEVGPEQSLIIGLTCVTISCFSSAFAGVYFEKVLKTVNTEGEQKPASLWMRNIQLSFFSVCIAVCQNAFREDTGKPYLHGFSSWVWSLVLIQSAGGLLVAAVMKYADNVLKGLATGVSVVLATTVSIFLFGTPITLQFSVGALMILASVYFFSNPLPNFQKANARIIEREIETQALVK